MFTRTRRIAVVLCAGVVLTACGGDEPPPAPTAPPPAATGSGSVAPGTPTSIAVGQTFYFAGFMVEVGTASYTPASGTSTGRVEVEAAFTNLGSGPATFDGSLSLASAGMFYEPSFDQELPQVPGASTGAGSFVFDVDPSFTLDDAVLTIGLAENNRAVVPFGASGDAVSLEPTTLTLRGKTKAGVLSLALNGGEIRADVPERHDQIEAGSLALTLEFDVTNRKSYAGGFAFSYPGNLALDLPDGTTVAADDGPVELLTQGTTLPGQVVRFTIPDPPAGTYALVLIDNTVERRGKVTFEIA